MEASLKKISKFLSLVLRHKPETIGIELDSAGWVSVESLLNAANSSGTKIDRDLLLQVVHENDKQRFAISGDGAMIRANQGHSVDVELGYESQSPPPLLYHGTVGKFLSSIRQQGLIPGQRHHVHLSADEETATVVAARRGKPVILLVNSSAMSESGKEFYLSNNGVWLTDQVPPEFITFPDQS